ncbi:hypothetical protein SUC37_06745 [Streptococcus agalactiae]|nr:hypothetical protein [Streptococcus agalactiae]MBY5051927.1 hypothetical protein [Streptococcus agalactiae]MCD0151308.1 hypothetical protein [Streptococcus agalactiae]HEM9564445.1 hypothetical protein [Streptococcus agalactiae]HEM9615700.1 hypothetical protein [Streptococcus agalactiae]HEM9617687.1 hypothetical protein [Streptococcus agalactiae]
MPKGIRESSGYEYRSSGLAGTAMVIDAMHLAKRCHREKGVLLFSTK